MTPEEFNEVCHSAKAEDFPAWLVVLLQAMTGSCSSELSFTVSTGFRDSSLPDLPSVSLYITYLQTFVY